MNNRLLRLAAVMLFLSMLVTGCGTGSDRRLEEDRGKNGEDTALNIVTSFYPVYVAVINVIKDVPDVTAINMTKPQTGCLHDYALKPEDLKTLEKADVFVINGAGMEAFLDDVIRQQKDLTIIEASKGIPLLRDDNGEENPHVWVSISNAVTYVNNIGEQLAQIDQKNAVLYRKNAAEYSQKLEALKEEMHAVLDKMENRDIITFHEAFPYFAQEFNLRIAAVVEREPGSEPVPKELAQIIDTIRETGINALFAEPQYSSKAADTISRETGASVYTLDPVVTGEATPEALDSYIDAMRANLDTLKEALK